MLRCLRDAADIYYGKSPSEVIGEDGDIPVIGTGGIYGKAIRALFSGPAVVVPRKGSLNNPQYVDGPFWPVDTTYAVLPKNDIDARWLFYSLDRFDLTKLNEATGVPSINRDWLYKLPLNGVNFEIQRRIAEILSTIDEAIEQTEALIAKMQQIKAGLMHDLFTRGVTPDGQLRPPRSEAPHLYKESPLGWIPKEWEVETLVDVGTWMSGGTPSKAQPLFWNGPLPWVTPKDMKVFRIDSTQDKLTEQGATTGSRIVPEGSIFIVVRGMILAHTFPVCLSTCRMAFNQDVKAILPRPGVYGEFLAYWFVANRDHVLGLVTEATHGTKRIDQRDLLRSHIAIPPLEEQSHLTKILCGLDEKLACETEDANKLREAKAGLMADLLTGRVHVSEMISAELREDATDV